MDLYLELITKLEKFQE